MEQFYIVDILDLRDPLSNPELLNDLPEERRIKCLKYRKPEDRKRSLGAGIIIHKILSGSEYFLGSNGKPESTNVKFSISHSGQYVIGVRSDSVIGCDIEQMREPRRKVADHFFSGRQVRYVFDGRSEGEKREAFWRVWTLSESYMKMTGEGLSLSLRKFEVVIRDHVSARAKTERVSVSEAHEVIFENCITGKQHVAHPFTGEIKLYREGVIQPCVLWSLSYDGHMIGLCRGTGNLSDIPL